MCLYVCVITETPEGDLCSKLGTTGKLMMKTKKEKEEMCGQCVLQSLNLSDAVKCMNSASGRSNE
jgi:hypothetical protein